MADTFKDIILEDLRNIIFNPLEGAEASLFINEESEEIPCNIFIDHDVLVQLDGYQAGVSTLGTTITAMVVDVGKPKNGTYFEIDEETTYIVKGIEENDGVTIKMKVVKSG